MRLDSIVFNRTHLISGLDSLQADSSALTAEALSVNDVTLDSRDVSAQRAFIAVKGAIADGHGYISDAITNGCKLVLCDTPPSADVIEQGRSQHCSILSIDGLKTRLADLLNTLFAIDEELHIAAVTGTNGKTSVASLYAQLALATNKKSASLGTLGLNVFSVTEHVIEQSTVQVGINTTPDIVTHYKVQSLLKQNGITDYCLEASSHGIEQQRLAGLPIATAIFTNLTQDHLDYHGTLAAYAKAKRGLLSFSSLRHLVLNADDPESKQWQANTPSGIDLAWYALTPANIPKQAKFFCVASDLEFTESGLQFSLTSSWGRAKVCSPLFGEFNVANLLAALSARLLDGEAFDSLIKQISYVKGVPGRMELFVNDSDNANMIVDYAHTPDALKQALIAARRHTAGKLYCIFGCGGDRDKSKRPLMGEAASRFGDVIVLTQDNTRNESALQIVNDIKAGIKNMAHVHVELDRQSAIRWACKNSSKHDLILIAGKGHEDYLEINNERIAYNEREFVQQLSASQCAAARQNAEATQ